MGEKLADYHIHTSFCNHANGTMKEYVRFAITAGLSEIGFSDHCPLPSQFDSHYRMLPDELPIYLKIIADLQTRFREIHIRIGIELDYIESATDYLKKFVAENNFDYVIGGVHYLNNDSDSHLSYLNDLPREKKSALFCKYFESIQQAANAGIFDIIAHFDLPRRFWGDLDDESVWCAKMALETIKKNDLCLEINTSGFRTKSVLEPFPGKNLLHLVREMDIPVTLGSDSHSPLDVGSYFREAIALLKEIGFKKISFFSHRKRRSIAI